MPGSVENAVAHAGSADTTPIRVAVLADVRLYREGLTLVLGGCAGIAVVGKGPSSTDTLRVIAEMVPDVVLVEARAAYATTVIRELARIAPRARVIAYGVTEETDEAMRCAESGAAGYVSKDATSDELVATVRSVAAGEFLCTPRFAALMLERIGHLAAQQQPVRGCVVLTPREQQIAVLLDEALSNKEIASRLGIGVSTVKNHVHHLLEKLNARRRYQAAAHVRRARLSP